MPLELKEATGRLGSRPRGGYSTSAATVSGSAALANEFTKVRRPAPKRAAGPAAQRGSLSRSGRVKLDATARTIVPTTGPIS